MGLCNGPGIVTACAKTPPATNGHAITPLIRLAGGSDDEFNAGPRRCTCILTAAKARGGRAWPARRRAQLENLPETLAFNGSDRQSIVRRHG
jgi:hypothetical protein